MGTSDQQERGAQRQDAKPTEPVTTAARRQSERLRISFGLTEREATIATLVCLGYGPSKLASRLSVSTNTVRTHLKTPIRCVLT
jgi:DNA-binding CsgD family transcriptional regulator